MPPLSPFRSRLHACLRLLPLLYLAGCGSGNFGSKSTPVTTTPVPATCVIPAATNVPVPAGCAYLGAFANPAGTGDASADLATLEQTIGRPLRLHMYYVAWNGGTATTPAASFPNSAMQNDLTATLGRRTPVVSWNCGDTNENVAAGLDDPLLIATAQAVRAYPAPLFLRWQWEMNEGTANGGAGRNGCFGATGSAGFIAAWQHIYNLFKAQGVTNVSWLWNPGVTPGDSDAAKDYPGDAYVDWIGFDAYDKIGANTYAGVISAAYNEYASHNKPILQAETGECPAYQSSYLADVDAELQSKSSTGYAFPLIRAFMYFDAPGNFTSCTWNFSSAGTTAFQTLGNDPYFSAIP